MGNLIPALFWLPLTVAGLGWMILHRQLLGPGLFLLGAATLLGWLAVNQFGLYQNSRMRRELERILRGNGDKLPQDRIFVGFSSPKYSGLLDAHEDVGFLCFLPNDLVFLSETRSIEVPRDAVQRVLFRPNPHTYLGLGRWISIEGVHHDKPLRMLIEPRNRKTMLGNRRSGRSLLAKVKRWMREPAACEPAP